MPLYNHLNKKITSRAAVYSRLTLLPYTHALSVVYTCGDADLDLLPFGNISVSVTVRAFILNDLTCSVTVRAGLNVLYHAEERLLGHHDLALASALGTGFGGRARPCAASVTGLAGLLKVKIQLLLAAENRLLKAYPCAGPYIGALHGAVVIAPPAPAASEQITEDITEDITEIH